MNSKHRILITEEHSILRAGLRALLNAQSDMEVVGEADTGTEAIRQMEILQADLVMIDVTMHCNNGENAISALKELYPAVNILVLTQHKNEEHIRTALRSGASGYVLKDASDAELMMAVRTVLSGKIYLTPSISEKVISVFLVGNKVGGTQTRADALTNREREILKYIAEGRTSKFIAETLGLSIKTIEKHRSNLMKKLDLHNVSALTTFAIGHGIVSTQLPN